MKRYKSETLSGEAINKYLSITKKDLYNFNTDVDMYIDSDPENPQKQYKKPKARKKEGKLPKYLREKRKIPKEYIEKWIEPYIGPQSRDVDEQVLDTIFHKLPRY